MMFLCVPMIPKQLLDSDRIEKVLREIELDMFRWLLHIHRKIFLNHFHRLLTSISINGFIKFIFTVL